MNKELKEKVLIRLRNARLELENELYNHVKCDRFQTSKLILDQVQDIAILIDELNEVETI